MKKRAKPAAKAPPAKPASGPAVTAAAGEDLEHVQAMFREYAQGVGASHCFEGFEDEVRNLPGAYAPPKGRLLIARVGRRPAGCVGVRAVDAERCEMKRLYVRPVFRGKGLGRALAERALAEAKKAGYKRMMLDTLPTMREALMLYAVLGFVSAAPYWPNPTPGALCFQKEL